MELAILNRSKSNTVSNFTASNVKIFESKMKTKLEAEKSFFENSFGKIYNDYIYLKTNEQKINIKEIAFLQVKTKADRIYNKLAFFSGLVLMIGFPFINNNYVYVALLVAILCLIVSITYKKENHFVQIVFCRADQIAIKIEKKQRNEIDVFIKKLSLYRHQNPHLKH